VKKAKRSHSPEVDKVEARKKMKPGTEDAPEKRWTRISSEIFELLVGQNAKNKTNVRDVHMGCLPDTSLFIVQ